MTGKQLNEKWKVGVKHALYDKEGKWYHVLTDFPGALFDTNGYLVFSNKETYMNCIKLKVNVGSNSVHVEGTIKDIFGYTFIE